MPGIDITPQVPADRQLIQGYGARGFRIAGQAYEGSVLVFTGRTEPWPVAAADGITIQSLEPITRETADIDILLIGCGGRFAPAPMALRSALKDAGMVLEWMDTGAACRTFNVLVSEDRRCAAALIAVD